MAINWTEAQVAELVAKVVAEMRSETTAAAPSWSSTQYNGRKLVGIYDKMEDAIAAAEVGYKAIRAMSVAERGVKNRLVRGGRNFINNTQ